MIFTIEHIKSKIHHKSLLTPITDSFIKKSANTGRNCYYGNFRCLCGTEKQILLYCVYTGKTKSCGCLLFEKVPKNKKYHLLYPSLKGVYYAMVSRCYNKNNKGYKTYGGRGVSVCKEWLDNPQSFFDWAILSGYKPGLTLDKDFNGLGILYSPNTCKWVTHQQNQLNTTRSRKILYNGELINICQLERISGISDETLRNRIFKLGLTAEEAINWGRWKRSKKTKTLTYEQYNIKWIKNTLLQIEVQKKQKVNIPNVGVKIVDLFIIPTYIAWENETQRHAFYMDSRKVGVFKLPGAKRVWYRLSQFNEMLNS